MIDGWVIHDDVIKWKYLPRYWPFVRGIHRSPVSSPHKGQWCGALMISLICAWINDWVNNRWAGHLRHHRAHYDVIVMLLWTCLRWMSLDLTDDKSALVQVMAWCRQATSHYLSQCWPRSPSPYGVSRPQWVNNCHGDMSFWWSW